MSCLTLGIRKRPVQELLVAPLPTNWDTNHKTTAKETPANREYIFTSQLEDHGFQGSPNDDKIAKKRDKAEEEPKKDHHMKVVQACQAFYEEMCADNRSCGAPPACPK